MSIGHTALRGLETVRVELARGRAELSAVIQRGGMREAAKVVAEATVDQCRYPMLRRRRMHERFRLLGHDLPYTLARYNNTFRNERSVEISVARWFLEQSPTGSMLEVGNVLGRYGISGHDVVDRYETIRGVINDDIVEFTPRKPYDTVVSISTLEHVGLDEDVRTPERAIVAFDKLVGLVKPRGRMLVTIPIGYNHALDSAVRSGRVSMPTSTILVRTDRENRWCESSLEEGLRCSYGHPFNNANAVWIGMTAVPGRGDATS